jgi:large subunit ribosomal protein L10
MDRKGKEAKVAQYDEAVRLAGYAIMLEYAKVGVVAFEQLRHDLEGLGAGVVVMKNTLARIVFERNGLEQVSEYLAGPTVLIYGREEVAPVAKLVEKFMRLHKEVKVKAIIFDGGIFGKEQFKSFVNLPTKDEARSKLLGVLMAPQGNFVRVINAGQRVASVLKAYVDKAS